MDLIRENIELIKEHFRKSNNELLLTGRKVGKTQALLEILYEENILNNKNLILLVPDRERKLDLCERIDSLNKKYIKISNKNKKQLKQSITTFFDYDYISNIENGNNERLLIDDYFDMSKRFITFRFAICTPHKPIEIERLKNSLDFEKLKQKFTEREYKLNRFEYYQQK